MPARAVCSSTNCSFTHKRFRDVVSSYDTPCMASTSCTRSHMAATEQNHLISKIRRQWPIKPFYVAPLHFKTAFVRPSVCSFVRSFVRSYTLRKYHLKYEWCPFSSMSDAMLVRIFYGNLFSNMSDAHAVGSFTNLRFTAITQKRFQKRC